MAKVLLTGVAGFICSHLATYLMEQGHEVWGVDDCSGGFESNVPKGVEWSKSSVNGLYGKGNCLPFGDEEWKIDFYRPFDAVYHLAAYAAELLSPHIPMFNYQNNLSESVALITACQNGLLRKGGRFVFTSSIAAYGHPISDTLLLPESAHCHPADPYGVSKLAVEHHLHTVAARWPDFEYTVFRPHNVISSHQNIADNYRNVAAIFVRQALRGEPLRVFGDGQQTRQFSHVKDVVLPIALAPFTQGTRNETFNVGNDEVYTVMDVAKEVIEALGLDKPGCTPYPIHHEPERGEVKHIQCSHAKLRRVFSEAGIPLPDPLPLKVMVRDLAQWAKTRPIPEVTPSPPIEVRDGLPPSWEVAK